MCYTFSTLFDLKVFAHTFLKNQLGKAFGLQFRDNPWWYLLKNRNSNGRLTEPPIPPASLRQTFESNANKVLYSWYRLILCASRHWYHCIIVSLYCCIIVSLHYCIIISLYHCIIVSPYHCIIVSLYHHITVSLYHCIILLLYNCIIALIYVWIGPWNTVIHRNWQWVWAFLFLLGMWEQFAHYRDCSSVKAFNYKM